MTQTPATDQRAWVHTRDGDGSRLAAAPQLALPMTITEPGTIHVYTIALPFAPPSKNVFDSWHWTVQRSVKGKWRSAVEREVIAQQMPLGLEKVGLSAVVFFPDVRRRDTQNYANALWHFVPDALVRARVLVDDNDGRVEYPPNLGVRFSIDDRRTLTPERRRRTVVSIACRLPD